MDAPRRYSIKPNRSGIGFYDGVVLDPNGSLMGAAEHDRIVAEKDAEIARLRHQIHEASEPAFLFGAMDNVHDMGVTLADFADAASRAIRAALENRDANI